MDERERRRSLSTDAGSEADKPITSVKPFLASLFDDGDSSGDEDAKRGIGVLPVKFHVLSKSVVPTHRTFKEAVRRESSKPLMLNAVPSTDHAPLTTRTAPPSFCCFERADVVNVLNDRHRFEGDKAAQAGSAVGEAVLRSQRLKSTPNINHYAVISEACSLTPAENAQYRAQMLRRSSALIAQRGAASELQAASQASSFVNNEKRSEQAHLAGILLAIDAAKKAPSPQSMLERRRREAFLNQQT